MIQNSIMHYSERFMEAFSQLSHIEDIDFESYIKLINSYDFQIDDLYSLIKNLILSHPSKIKLFNRFYEKLDNFLENLHYEFNKYYSSVWFARMILLIYLDGLLDLEQLIDSDIEPEKLILVLLFLRDFINPTDDIYSDITSILDSKPSPDRKREIKAMRITLDLMQNVNERKYLILNGYNDHTIAAAIARDDVDLLIELSTDPSFDVNAQIGPLFFMTNPTTQEISLIQLAAKNSAINCFKLLISNNANLDKIEKYIIQGGNLEIFRIFEKTSKYNFQKIIGPILQNGSPEMIEWVLERIDINNDQNNREIIDQIRFIYFHMEDTKYPALNVLLQWSGQLGVQLAFVFASDSIKFGKLLLLDISLNILDYDLQMINSMNPLIAAVNTREFKIVKLLLESKNFLINETDPIGETPLIKAIVNESIDIIDLLLSIPQIDINKKSKNGSTPLHFACRVGNHDIVKKLLSLESIKADELDNYRSTPFLEAVEQGNPENVKEFCQRKDVNIFRNTIYDKSALHIAAEEGNEKVVSLLLDYGLSKDTLSGSQKKPYDVALPNVKHLLL